MDRSVAIIAALAAACVGPVLVLGVLVARAAGRSRRGVERAGTARLVRAAGGRLAGSVPGRALRSLARDAAADSFWDAMEAIALTLRRRERMQLARSLERNRHVRAERRALAGGDSPALRERAARRLALLPSPLHRAALRRALVRGPEAPRLAAARGLATLRDLEALKWLCAHPGALSSRPLPALAGLLRGFGPRARALLIRALDRGIPDTRFECAVLDALGATRCRSARERIEQRLAAGAVDSRVAAARALGRLGMGESIPALMAALGDGAWPVRAQSAHALGRLRAAPAVDALARLTGDSAWWVRRHAAHALAAVGPEGQDALCEVILRSEDPFAREMAREALDRIATRRSA